MRHRLPWLGAAILVALALFVFRQVPSHEFVHLDDDVYVTDNPRVASGLSAESVRWAFTTTHAGFWQPLTWLSLMLDAHLFGLDPGAFHVTNLLWHIASTLLLFLALERMTGAAGRSLLVAAVFAVHPLHVESVAWVTERKDLLFAAFGFTALGAYLRYARQPGPGRMALVAACYAASLMAKQMLVTLPFLLLLLDWWPLGRLAPRRSASLPGRTTTRALLLEKTPLFALAAAAGAGAYAAQSSWGAVSTVDTVRAASRLANAAVAYAAYLGKTVWPARLSPLYLVPDAGQSPATVALAAALLLAACAAVALRRSPPLTVGWLWFLGTLVPVIGFVQIGLHFMADRFMYVPIVGLGLAAAWGNAVPGARRGGGTAVSVAAVAAVVAFAGMASHQAGVWRSSGALFEHALRLDPGNWFARYCLGNAFMAQRRFPEAEASYREGLRLHPNFRRGNNNLGLALLALDRPEEAAVQFRLAIQAKPDEPLPHANLGVALARLGRTEAAATSFRQALRLDSPGGAAYRQMWGLALAAAGETGAAIAQLEESVRLDPANAQARNNLGSLLAGQGRREEARAHFREAIRLKPDYPAARANLGRLDPSAAPP